MKPNSGWERVCAYSPLFSHEIFINRPCWRYCWQNWWFNYDLIRFRSQLMVLVSPYTLLLSLDNVVIQAIYFVCEKINSLSPSSNCRSLPSLQHDQLYEINLQVKGLPSSSSSSPSIAYNFYYQLTKSEQIQGLYYFSFAHCQWLLLKGLKWINCNSRCALYG